MAHPHIILQKKHAVTSLSQHRQYLSTSSQPQYNKWAVGTDANKKYEDYLYDAAQKKDIDKNQKSYSNTFFFAEQSNKYFDSWTSLVGADGYTPIAGSPLPGAASFAGWTGFDTVSYIGAFDGSNNWMSGWTNFDPQNAQY